MDLHAILIRAPVNRLAASVVSQRRVAQHYEPLTKPELVYLYERVQRKQRLLKVVLGIRSMTNKKNLKYRYNKGQRSGAAKSEPRAWAEFRACGQQLLRLCDALSEIKRARHNAMYRANPAL